MTDFVGQGCGCIERKRISTLSLRIAGSSSTSTQMLMLWRTGYKIFWLQTIFLLLNILPSTQVSSYDFQSTSSTWTNAKVVLTYDDPVTRNKTRVTNEDFGRFGSGPVGNAQGFVIHGRASGCIPYDRKTLPQKKTWIALVKRGNCTESQKVAFAQQLNASAVVMYNDQPGTEITTIPNTGMIDNVFKVSQTFWK